MSTTCAGHLNKSPRSSTVNHSKNNNASATFTGRSSQGTAKRPALRQCAGANQKPSAPCQAARQSHSEGSETLSHVRAMPKTRAYSSCETKNVTYHSETSRSLLKGRSRRKAEREDPFPFPLAGGGRAGASVTVTGSRARPRWPGRPCGTAAPPNMPSRSSRAPRPLCHHC